MKVLRAFVLGAVVLGTTPAMAVQPDEMLSDPRLEQRARDLSRGLRCLVCRNESIDDSNASLARDLRLLLRERLTMGDTDAQAVAFLVDRYGEFVLLTPTAGGSNLILWWSGPAMLVAGLGISALYVRSRRKIMEPETALSNAESARLTEILKN